MSRRRDIVLWAAIAAVIVLAVLAVLATRNGQSTTFRNLTRDAIAYSVRPWDSNEPPETRELPPDGLDRIRTKKPLEVTYPSFGRTILFIASPGKPYTFRYNEEDRVQLYPGSHGLNDAVDLAPFVQTPMPVVRKMLEMADLGPDDVLYDLGCGDGRIVITAAKTYGVRGVGIEIDPDLIAVSRKRAEQAGVSDLTRFLRMDATRADLSEATVVTLYLLPESNEILRPRLEEQLPPGARVLSHNFSMPGWQDRLVRRETVADDNGLEHTVYLYRLSASEPGPDGIPPAGRRRP